MAFLTYVPGEQFFHIFEQFVQRFVYTVIIAFTTFCLWIDSQTFQQIFACQPLFDALFSQSDLAICTVVSPLRLILHNNGPISCCCNRCIYRRMPVVGVCSFFKNFCTWAFVEKKSMPLCRKCTAWLPVALPS